MDKQITPDQILRKHESEKRYRLKESETYKQLVVYPAIEEAVELARQEKGFARIWVKPHFVGILDLKLMWHNLPPKMALNLKFSHGQDGQE
jgi:hypothetical protein